MEAGVHCLVTKHLDGMIGASQGQHSSRCDKRCSNFTRTSMIPVLGIVSIICPWIRSVEPNLDVNDVRLLDAAAKILNAQKLLALLPQHPICTS
jgi:hypothetical protein